MSKKIDRTIKLFTLLCVGKTYDEVAAELGISRGRVSQIVKDVRRSGMDMPDPRIVRQLAAAKRHVAVVEGKAKSKSPTTDQRINWLRLTGSDTYGEYPEEMLDAMPLDDYRALCAARGIEPKR